MRQRLAWRTNATTIVVKDECDNDRRRFRSTRWPHQLEDGSTRWSHRHAKRNPESMATPRARVAVASCRRALGIGDYEGDSDRRVVCDDVQSAKCSTTCLGPVGTDLSSVPYDSHETRRRPPPQAVAKFWCNFATVRDRVSCAPNGGALCHLRAGFASGFHKRRSMHPWKGIMSPFIVRPTCCCPESRTTHTLLGLLRTRVRAAATQNLAVSSASAML